MTIYKKLSDNEYQITESKEEVSMVNLDFIKTDIEHKDKLIANLQEGIDNLEKEKADLEKLVTDLNKVK